MTVHTVQVQFHDGSGIYSYLSDKEFVEGDFAVVESPHNGLVVVKVVGVTLNHRDAKAYKWIVDAVDLAGHRDREAKAKRAEYLKARLATKRKAVEERAIWKYLAEQDAEAKALLDELDSLS